LPTLVIHAQYDHIIPFSHGQALFDACPSQRKLFYEVPGANHNDIFFVNMAGYMNTLQSFLQVK
ncbi:MAG: alpha/beta hydrolase, partial [Desulfatibacillaceae bacterium]|nr:alpha/beta hydrolase [Desulfatibacillaceae bacterium]